MGFLRKVARKSVRKVTPRPVRQVTRVVRHPVRTTARAVTPRPIRQAQRSVFNITHPVNAVQNKIVNAAIGQPIRYAPRQTARSGIPRAASEAPASRVSIAASTTGPSHEETLYESIRDLANAPDASSRPHLIAAAGHDDPVVRKLAIRGISRLGDAADTRLLLTALSDPSDDVRVEAAHWLVYRATEEFREPLTNAVEDPNELVRECATHALATLDNDADGSSSSVTSSSRPEPARLSVDAADPVDLTLALRVAAHHGELELSVRDLLDVFGRQRLTDAALDEIEDMLEQAGLRSDPDPSKLELNARVRLIREEAIPEFALRAHVDDSGPWTMSVTDLLRSFDRSKLTARARTEIAEALDYAGLDTDPPIVGADPDQELTIKRIERTAFNVGHPLEALERAAEEVPSTPPARGPVGTNRESLLAALSDPDEDVRYEALSGLGDHLGPDLVPVIAPLLESPEKYTRRRALDYYARLAPPDVKQRLLAALSDPDEDVRAAAEDALSR